MKLSLYKQLYCPLCRAYARHILRDRPADSIYRSLCALQFWRKHRFWPDFVNPRRFSEKLWSRMLHDRDPVLTALSDKLRVRDYVAMKTGAEYLVPLLWSGNSPDDLPFDELPLEFVIKANHGCGFNIIIRDKTEVDRAGVRRQLGQWLARNYCEDYRLGVEWSYKHIKPAIMIERFMAEQGKAPVDYKFWCFSGRVECITSHFDRFDRHRVRTLDRGFAPYAYPFPLDNGEVECRRPENHSEMLGVAEALAAGFEFMRVDLYNIHGRIYFGEMTPYPGGIYPMLLAPEPDLLLGAKWQPGKAAADFN